MKKSKLFSLLNYKFGNYCSPDNEGSNNDGGENDGGNDDDGGYDDTSTNEQGNNGSDSDNLPDWQQ